MQTGFESFRSLYGVPPSDNNPAQVPEGRPKGKKGGCGQMKKLEYIIVCNYMVVNFEGYHGFGPKVILTLCI